MKDPAGYTFQGFTIPGHTAGGLLRWVEKGTPPGGFLQAVLMNDLKNAVGRADLENLRNLPAMVGWLYNEAPMGCYGSEELYYAWFDAKQKERDRDGN